MYASVFVKKVELPVEQELQQLFAREVEMVRYPLHLIRGRLAIALPYLLKANLINMHGAIKIFCRMEVSGIYLNTDKFAQKIALYLLVPGNAVAQHVQLH